MPSSALAAGCSETTSPPPADSAQETRAAADPSGAAPKPGEVRYLALGDSLTQGVGAPDEQAGAFPALLAQRWRADGCEVELQNAGISGYTAGQILAEQVPQIESFGPTIVTFQPADDRVRPAPPFDSGDLAKASAEVTELATEFYRHRSWSGTGCSAISAGGL